MKRTGPGDLFIAMSLDKGILIDALRLLLYLFAQIEKGNLDGKRQGPKGIGFVFITKQEILKDLPMLALTYEHCKDFIIEHKLLGYKKTENGDIWTEELRSNWNLKRLPSIQDASLIEQPILYASGLGDDDIDEIGK